MADLPAPSPSGTAIEPATSTWGLGTTIGALAVAGASAVLGSAVLGAVLVFSFGSSYLARHTLEVNILAYQFLALGVIISAVWLVLAHHHVGPDMLGFRFPGWERLGTAVLTGLAALFAGTIAISSLFSALFPHYGLQGNAKQVLAGVHPHMPALLTVLVVLWAGVEAPIVEETLFRGIVFQGLRTFFQSWFDRIWSVFVAAVSSGLLFGLAHFEPKTLPILFFVGVLLAYVFQYGRSIFASILVHGVLNASVTIYLLHSTS